MSSFEALTRARGILYGGDYNPEQWPPHVWREDVALMRAAGVNLVTVGVFSWAMLEPRPDELRWDWLDEVLDLLHEGGIAVDLATPSASPPPWLARLDPTTLRGGRLGRPDERRLAQPVLPGVGGVPRAGGAVRPRARRPLRRAPRGRDVARRQRVRAGVLLRPVRRPVPHLARRTATATSTPSTAPGAPPSGASGTATGRRSCRRAPLPTCTTRRSCWTSGGSPPTSCGTCTACRRRSSARSSTAPVTTNAMGFFPLVDQFSWADDLDVVADDHYADPADPSSPARAALTHDLTRGVGGGRPWALLEQAAGAVSWRPHNLPKPAGGMLRDSLRAVAHGADAVCYFQWRASAQGSERFHSAMLPHAGPDTDLHRAVREQGRLLGRLRSVVGTAVDARVALVFDWPSLWAGEADSVPSTLLRVPDQLAAYHEPFWRAGIATDVVPPGADLDRYDLVVVPLLHLVSDADAANLARVASRGGTLLVGPFSGIADEDQRIRQGRFPVPWADVLGVSGEQHRPLPAAGVPVRSERYGSFTASLWSEHLTADGAEVLATYAGAGLDGRPAILRHGTRLVRLDRAAGTGARRDRGGLRRGGRRGAAGARPCPDGVEVALRGDLLFVLNHGDADAELAWTGHDLLTQTDVDGVLRLPAGGAAVLARRGSGAAPRGQDGREEAGLGGLVAGEPADRHVDRDGADGVRGQVDGGQGLGLPEGHVLRADGDDGDVAGHVLAAGPQRLEHRGQGDLVVHDDAGDVRQGREHLVDGLDGAAVGGLAGLEDGVEAEARGLLREPAHQAGGVGGPSAEHRPGGADEGDLAVPEPREVGDRGPSGGLEVQVDAGEPGGVAGQPDEHGGLALLAQDGQPGVLGLDVHHDHGVDHGAGRDALDPVVVVLGEQQDVVLERLRARDHAGDELHDHADVDVDAQRRHEREDLGALRRERPGAGVRAVVELADGALDAGAGLGGDRSLAGERVGHGRHRDPRHACHVVDRRHLVIPSSTPAGATLASRSAVETAVAIPPSWTASTLPFNVIPASKRFDERNRSSDPRREGATMKFTDGYWQHLPGVTVLRPRERRGRRRGRGLADGLRRDGAADVRAATRSTGRWSR